MSRYLETAQEASVVADRIYKLVDENRQPEVAELLARLYNLGVRSNPRPAQGTVRRNAVTRMAQNLPITIGMEKHERQDGSTFNVLTINGHVPKDE